MAGWLDANPAGFDTKIMKNCGKVHLKRTKTDRLMSRLVALVSCPEPPPRAWRHAGGEGQHPAHRQTPQRSSPQALSSAKLCGLILGIRARDPVGQRIFS